KWTDTVITIYPSKPFPADRWAGALQSTNAQLNVVRQDGQAAKPLTVELAPAIAYRVGGQCTWWVARRRRELGLSVGTYSQHRAIDATYTPQGSDQLRWEWIGKSGNLNRHAAFVESVRRKPDRQI